MKKAVRTRFDRQVLIQRCCLHKERNIQKYLPKKYHKLLAMKLRAAWGMMDYQEANKQLYKVHHWLACINQAAAKSLEEGFEETLTVNRPGLPEQLCDGCSAPQISSRVVFLWLMICVAMSNTGVTRTWPGVGPVRYCWRPKGVSIGLRVIEICLYWLNGCSK